MNERIIMSASELIWTLLEVSERAARIARECRAKKELFELLVEEKKGAEKNPRFVEDFKTLADVLVQETVKHHVCKKWPELRSSIFGEENNRFTNAKGQSVTVEVKSSESDTAQLLKEVLDGNQTAANLLAHAVHREPQVNETAANDFKSLQDKLDDHSIPLDDMAIWIDPIDGTSEYIKGQWDDSQPSKFGLSCCTILIGGYVRSSGLPLFGVVSQPFATEDGRRTASYFSFQSIHNIRSFPLRYTVVISTTEGPEIRDRLESEFTVTTASGAGYKILTVVLGWCEAYLCTRGSTFRWDTCAPHALLVAQGGGVRAFEENVPIVYDVGEKLAACNSKGLIAYRSKEILNRILTVLDID